MAKVKSAAIILALIALVIMSGYFFYKNIFSQTKIILTNKSKPNVIIHDIDSVSFNKEGKIASKMYTPNMAYNSYTKYSTVIKPNILIYKANSAPWHITAKQAEIINGNSIYKLIGNVILHQGPSNKSLEMTIKTSELTFYSDKKIAETFKPISFTQRNKDKSSVTIHSIGARVNQKTGEVKLFSQARGVFHGNKP